MSGSKVHPPWTATQIHIWLCVTSGGVIRKQTQWEGCPLLHVNPVSVVPFGILSSPTGLSHAGMEISAPALHHGRCRSPQKLLFHSPKTRVLLLTYPRPTSISLLGCCLPSWEARVESITELVHSGSRTRERPLSTSFLLQARFLSHSSSSQFSTVYTQFLLLRVEEPSLKKLCMQKSSESL